MAVEQALYTGLYIILPRAYYDYLHDPLLWLTAMDSQLRYFGLCYVMCVYACFTYQSITYQFTRIYAVRAFKP